MFVKDEEIIDQYVRLTPFLAHVLGQGCEVVVHDLTKPGHTLAAVYNSPAARTAGYGSGWAVWRSISSKARRKAARCSS